MPDRESEFTAGSTLRAVALARWENEGGAWGGLMEAASVSGRPQHGVPPLTNTELVQLRIRVIALENLVVALLTDASDRQLELIRDMAAYISPRPGFTPHPVTIHAAAQMVSLAGRADQFSNEPPS